MPSRLSFLPAPMGAALTAVLLAILGALYFPLTAIVCGPPSKPHVPDVRTGTAFINKPETVVVAMGIDGRVAIDRVFVRDRAQLREMLTKLRTTHPNARIEIAADRRASTDNVLRLFAAVRDAGFEEAYVFGHEHTLLESPHRD